MSSDFDRLQPDLILSAIEKAGFFPTGEYSQLNSYENRVFDMRLEVSPKAIQPIDRVIAKFYRPNRWSKEAIQDEHDFLNDLVAEGIPAVPALPLKPGGTCFDIEGYIVALFPRVVGRNPQEFLAGELKQVGRSLAHIHNVGSRKPAKHRPTLGPQKYGWDVLPRLARYVYPELWPRYEEVATHLLEYLEDELDSSQNMRIHGDCHKGNLLHSAKGEFFFVDFDDFCNGPAIQDFWMLLSSGADEDESQHEQDEICLGYEELRKAPEQWYLMEPLRGLRIIHYAGWIAQRWNDQFFKRIFPDFETYNYWLQELQTLEKIAHRLN
jgi:Ser/Thr protein kinase RdoA (MazF antagonist)